MTVAASSSQPLDWSLVPTALNPTAAGVKAENADRKRAQLESFVRHLQQCRPQDGEILVDFGSGSGHLGLLVAFLYPRCRVVLVEPNAYRCDTSKTRAAELGLSNCVAFQGTLDEFALGESNPSPSTGSMPQPSTQERAVPWSESTGQGAETARHLGAVGSCARPFDIGLGLHPCGILSDRVMEICLAAQAAYIISPCCYGQVASNAPGLHPRSHLMQQSGTADELSIVASASDFTVRARDWDFPSQPAFQLAKRSMRVIDADRNLWASESRGYGTYMSSLEPLTCSPKNNVIVGVPPTREWEEALEHWPAGLAMPAMGGHGGGSSSPLPAPAPFPTLQQQRGHQKGHQDPNDAAQLKRVAKKASKKVEELKKAGASKEAMSAALGVAKEAKRIAKQAEEAEKAASASSTTAVSSEAAKEEGEEEEEEEEYAMPALSYIDYRPEDYPRILARKVAALSERFSRLAGPVAASPCVFASPARHYRLRARLMVLEDDRGELGYYMWDKGLPTVRLEAFPVASLAINSLMPRLLEAVSASPPLRQDLQAVHFLGSLHGDMVASLVYKAPFGADWRPAAVAARSVLGCHLIGKYRGHSECVDQGHVEEALHLPDGRVLRYKQVEGAFSNPNGVVNAMSLGWLCEVVNGIKGKDLLELYCGNGNHTVALAPMFRRAVAVELSKSLCEAAEVNLALNGVTNARILQVHSHRFCSRVLKKKCYEDETGRYEFGTVLVDPPRAGLDDETLRLVATYEHVLYISCNQDALYSNLEELLRTHVLRRFAIFDQFAYTEHIECGIYLERKPELGGGDGSRPVAEESIGSPLQQLRRQLMTLELAPATKEPSRQPGPSDALQLRRAANKASKKVEELKKAGASKETMAAALSAAKEAKRAAKQAGEAEKKKTAPPPPRVESQQPIAADIPTVVLSPTSRSKRQLNLELVSPDSDDPPEIQTVIISPTSSSKRQLEVHSAESIVANPVTPEKKPRPTVDTSSLSSTPADRRVLAADEPPNSPDKSPGCENSEWSRGKYISNFLHDEETEAGLSPGY